MIRVGIIGLGFMGKTHFDIYKEMKGVKVTAVADIDPKKRAGEFPAVGNLGNEESTIIPLKGIEVYEDADKTIKEADIDMIDICLPTYMHVEHVLKALKSGRHVFCEKPLGIDGVSSRRVVRAARNAKGLFMTGLCLRFWPEYEFLKTAVDTKRYGKVVSASFRRVSPAPTWSWDNWLLDENRSGSAALDLHIHDTDFIIFLLGKPTHVRSVGQSRVSKGIDHITTHYMYKKNVMVVAEGAWLYHPSYPFSMSFSVACEHATIDYDSRMGDGLTVHLDNGSSEKPKLTQKSGHQRELEYFTKCIKQGTVPTVVTPKDAAIAVEVVQAELKSCEMGKTVKV